MSSPLAPLSATSTSVHGTSSSAAATAANVDPKRAAKLHTAAKAFESILVKQLLSAAKVGGQNPSGYADMAVDALATGVEKAGGLGLARRIEDTLSHSLSRARETTGESPPVAAAGGPAAVVPTQPAETLDEVGGR